MLTASRGVSDALADFTVHELLEPAVEVLHKCQETEEKTKKRRQAFARKIGVSRVAVTPLRNRGFDCVGFWVLEGKKPRIFGLKATTTKDVHRKKVYVLWQPPTVIAQKYREDRDQLKKDLASLSTNGTYPVYEFCGMPSSVLLEKDHRIIYPSIVEIKCGYKPDSTPWIRYFTVHKYRMDSKELRAVKHARPCKPWDFLELCDTHGL